MHILQTNAKKQSKNKNVPLVTRTCSANISVAKL